MQPSTIYEITKALGIPDTISSRWKAGRIDAPVNESKPRFDIDGPIVDNVTASIFRGLDGIVSPKALREFLAKNEGADIDIVINSPGGSVYDGFSMRGELMRHEGFVNVIVNGLCASAATYFLCLPNSHRIAMPGSELMIHNAAACACGDWHELNKVADHLQRINENVAGQLAGVTNLEKDDVLRMMDEETWFDDAQALDAGLVDEIYEPSEQAEEPGEEPEPEGGEDEVIDEKPEALKAGDQLAMLRVARIIESVPA